MKRLYLTAASVALAALLSGCASLVSAIPPSAEPTTIEELQRENRRMKESLETSQHLNNRLAYELEVARIDLQRAQASLAAEGARPQTLQVPAFRDVMPSAVTLGLLTGPADWDREQPGNDGIAVYLKVKDTAGTTLKRLGNVLVDLIDISRGENVIMSWAIPAQLLLDTWQPFPPGYRIRLPWQGPVPWGDSVVLRVAFTDAFGRQFTASRTLRLERETGQETQSIEEEGE